MGLSQPRHSSTHTGRFTPQTGYPHGIADTPGTLEDSHPLRTVFVMNDELLRHGLMHVVSQASGVRFVGDLRHGAGLTDRLRALRPDLLVVGVDRSLPLSTLLAELDPVPKVIVVIDSEEVPPRALELIRAGADALVDRRSPSADLFGTVQRVIQGQTALDAYSAHALIAELRSRGDESGSDTSRLLTRREREVLSLLTDGLDNRVIAAKLFITEATVKFHLHNIMGKFDVHKRAALVSVALRGRIQGDGHGVAPVAQNR
jgi:DNA-binding NarL/FixJ family response regulator